MLRDTKIEKNTVVISPSSSVKYIPVISPLALSNTSGFSNVKNAVPEVPSLLLVSFTSGTDVSTVSRTKEIVAALVTTNARRETETEVEEEEDLLLVTNDCERKVEVVRDARADKVVDIVVVVVVVVVVLMWWKFEITTCDVSYPLKVALEKLNVV